METAFIREATRELTPFRNTLIGTMSDSPAAIAAACNSRGAIEQEQRVQQQSTRWVSGKTIIG